MTSHCAQPLEDRMQARYPCRNMMFQFRLHRTDFIFRSLYRSVGPPMTLAFPNSAVLRHSTHVGAFAAQSLETRLDHGAQGAFSVTHVDQLLHTACLQKGSQTASGVLIGPFNVTRNCDNGLGWIQTSDQDCQQVLIVFVPHETVVHNQQRNVWRERWLCQVRCVVLASSNTPLAPAPVG